MRAPGTVIVAVRTAAALVAAAGAVLLAGADPRPRAAPGSSPSRPAGPATTSTSRPRHGFVRVAKGQCNVGAYCIDRDGDGYGVACARGPDADDADPKVNTPESVIAKYGDLDSFLKHRGYRSNRIVYVAGGGKRPPGKKVAYPSLSAAKIRLRPGDVVVFYGGTYRKQAYPIACSRLAGRKDRPIVFLAYPGQRVVLDSMKVPITVGNSRHLIFDGFVLDRSGGGKLSHGVSMHKSSNITFKNIEAMNFNSGVKATHIHNVVFDSSVFHDNSEHGIYLCAREIINTDVTVSNSLSYRNGRHGLQHNGRARNLLVAGNVFHSNSLGGVNLTQGVSNSVIRNNLIFNNNRSGIYLYLYDDRGPTIHSFDQNNNVIENNIIWIGTYSWQDDGKTEPARRAAVRFNDATAAQKRSMEGNAFIGNVLVTQRGAAFRFDQKNAADKTTITSNIIFRAAGKASVMLCEGKAYNMAAFQRFSRLIGDNVFTNPGFADVSAGYFKTPERFDFSHKLRLAKRTAP